MYYGHVHQPQRRRHAASAPTHAVNVGVLLPVDGQGLGAQLVTETVASEIDIDVDAAGRPRRPARLRVVPAVGALDEGGAHRRARRRRTCGARSSSTSRPACCRRCGTSCATPTRDDGIAWDYVEGDLKDIRGSYTVEAAGRRDARDLPPRDRSREDPAARIRQGTRGARDHADRAERAEAAGRGGLGHRSSARVLGGRVTRRPSAAPCGAAVATSSLNTAAIVLDSPRHQALARLLRRQLLLRRAARRSTRLNASTCICEISSRLSR